MKIFIEYDEQGTIKSVDTWASLLSEEQDSDFVPHSDYQVIEVELPDVKDVNTYDLLHEIMRYNRIEDHDGEYRLVLK